MKFISLFAGIGGFDLGLERAGMECVAQVEIDPFCQKVLAKHWPHVMRLSDVRECGKHNLPPADLICGGFPCQDVSLAGKRAGLDGKRSTLWGEFYRIICELRPRWVIIENVPGLLSSDNGEFIRKIFRELAQGGYDAEWQIISARDAGAPHRRERIFIVAYPGNNGLAQAQQDAADRSQSKRGNTIRPRITGCSTNVAHPASERLPQRAESEQPFAVPTTKHGNSERGQWWSIEPPVGRVANGVPGRVDRLRALGNAVVPQVVEWIGKMIMAAEETQ